MTSMKLTQEQIAAVRALEDSGGNVSARQILDAAKDKANPLHSLFDWNVKRAAEKYWLHQARLVIGAVTVQVVTTEFTYKTSAYVSSGQGEGYRSVIALKSDEQASRESLIHCLEVSRGHLKRALDLAMPLGLSDQIDHLIEQTMAVARIVRQKEAA